MSIPYRASKHTRDAFRPTYRWTRYAAVAIAVLGATFPALVVRDLVLDHDCEKHATPHWLLAALVVGLALATAIGAMRLHRLMARHMTFSVRSRFVGVLVASLSIVPGVLLEATNVGAAILIDFSATFHLCLDFSHVSFPFSMGC